MSSSDTKQTSLSRHGLLSFFYLRGNIFSQRTDNLVLKATLAAPLVTGLLWMLHICCVTVALPFISVAAALH